MNAREAIEVLEDKGGIFVYELYDAREHRKTGGMYKNYADCVHNSGFDIYEFEDREIYDDIELDEFFDGFLMSHTDDFEWYIVATLLQ